MKTNYFIKRLGLSLVLLVIFAFTSYACDYQLKMVDTWGDGWNGGKVTVYVNGTAVITDATVSNGTGPDYITFSVNNGDQITTDYTQGSYGSENEYWILDVGGAEVGAEGVGGSTPGDITTAIIAVCPTCPPPTNQSVTDITATDAKLNWTTGGSTDFNVEYGPAGFTQGTGTFMAVATDEFKTITSLTAATSYDWYVQDSCGVADVSPWTGPYSFTTAINTFPWSDDVESHSTTTNSSISNGWSSIPTSTTGSFRWNVDGSGSTPSSSTGPSGAHSGSKYFYVEASSSGTGAIAELYSPNLDINNLNNAMISFYYHMYGASMGDLYIDINNGSWTTIDSIKGQQQTAATDAWLLKQIDISSYSGTIQIRFRAIRGSSFTGDISLDDIKIFDPPANDIEVSEIIGSYGGFDVSGADIVKVLVRNNGTNVQTSIPLNYTLDNGAVISETMPTLAAFSSDTFEFVTTFDATTANNHMLKAYSTLANDEDNSNDSIMMTFITNALTTIPSVFEFPNTDDLYFQLLSESLSSSAITPDANNGNGNGILLEGGSSSSGWVSYSNVTQAFANTTHVSKAVMKIDATGNAFLFMDFDLKQARSFGNSKYTWFRVMLNDTVYAKTLDGDSVWNPAVNETAWQTITLNLSDYAGTIFKLSLEGAMKYNASYSAPGCRNYIDNINLYVPPTNEVQIFDIIRNYGGLNVPNNDTVTVLVKNNGTSSQTALPISFKLDNGSVITENMPSLASFATDTFEFVATFDASAAGKHTLAVYTNLAGDADNANDTMFKTFNTYGTHTIPFTEDFENNYTYFENDNANINMFNIYSTLKHSGNNSVYNQYSANALDMLHETGVMDLTSSTTPVFDFWQIAKTEGGWDKCYIQISTDNGQNWVNLPDSLYLGNSSNYSVKGYFHEDSYSDWGTGSQTPDNSWWKMERFNLEAYKDDSVRLRFFIDSDGSGQRNGWYLDDITVQEEPTAVANLGNDTTLCAGTDITLNSGMGVGYTYIWTTDGDTLANTASSLTTDSSGTYTVQINGLATVSYDTIVITDVALPTVASFTGSADICATDSTQLAMTFTGASPWDITVSVNGAIHTQTGVTSPANPYDDPSDTTEYFITEITDANGCTFVGNSDTVMINVKPLPTVSIASLSDVCDGTSAFTLTVGTPATGTYSGAGVNSTAATFDATTAGAGNHDIVYTITDGVTGCTDSATTIQVVNALPNITASAGSNPVPYNTATTLDAPVSNAMGALSYLWLPSASIDGDSTIQTPNTILITAATQYVVKVTDAGSSCENTDTVDLVYSGGPISVSPISIPTSICFGDTAQVKAQSAGGNGNITYTWTSNPTGFTSTDENPFFNPTVDTWFIVEATDGANTAKDSVQVSIIAAPTASFTTDTTFICMGSMSNAILNFTGAAPFNYTYNGILVSGITTTVDTINVNTTSDIVYNVTSITDGNGCTANGDLDSVQFIMNALPTFTISDNDTMCFGDSVQITANFTGAAPYSFDVNDGSAVFTQTSATDTYTNYIDPDTTTNYVIESVTDNNGCNISGNLDSIFILVNQLATATVSDNDTMCFGDSVQLTINFNGVAPYSFVVNTMTQTSTSNTFNSWTSPAATTTYNLTSITDGNGCTAANLSESLEVFVNVLPAVPSFTGLNAAYCEDAAISTLSGLPTGGTFTGNGISGNDFDPSNANSGNNDIEYRITDVNGCQNFVVNSTTVNTLPSITITGLGAAYCEDASAVALTATPTGAGGVWTGAVNAANEFEPNVSGAGYHAVYYTFTDGNSCVNMDSATTIVNALPVVAVTTLADVCIDATIFTPSGATPTGGSWSGNGVNNNYFNANTAGAGSHYLVYSFTDGNGCTDLDSTTQVVNALPVLSLTGLASDYCADAPADTLMASPAGGTFYGVGLTDSIFDPSVPNTGSVSIMYMYTDANGCFNSYSATTMVNAIPMVNLGSDNTVCVNASSTLDAGNAGSSFVWNTGATTQTINIDSTGYGVGTFNYSVVVTDANTCTNTDSIDITYEALPLSQLSDTSTICGENSDITLDAGYIPGNTYVWSNGVSWSYITINASDLGGTTGNMSVVITSNAGCTTYDTTYVYFREEPTVDLGGDQIVCVNHEFTLDAGTGYTSYLWNTGATTQTITVDSTNFNVGNNMYKVEVTNNLTCTASDSMILVVDPCTGVATPELSNANINIYPNPTKGQFQIDVTGLENQDYNLDIFNSIGKVVYSDKVKADGANTQTWKLDFSNFAKGIYHIRLQSNGDIKVKRIVIQ